MKGNMNKYQEALDRIGRNYYLSQESGEFEHFENLYLENKKTLQELVDKAAPKKPIKKTYEDQSMNEEILIKTYYVCGCEKFSQVHNIDIFCSKCGQALDWSEE